MKFVTSFTSNFYIAIHMVMVTHTHIYYRNDLKILPNLRNFFVFNFIFGFYIQKLITSYQFSLLLIKIEMIINKFLILRHKIN